MRRTGPNDATQQLVADRDHRCCRKCGLSLAGQRGAIHHRRPRQMGGTRDTRINLPANLVCLCDRCHAEIESNRTAAEVDGWLVPRGHDPEWTPLKVAVNTDDWTARTRWVYLRNDGTESTDSPDAIVPEVDAAGRQVLTPAQIEIVRARYGHHLDEAADSASEDRADLAVEVHTAVAFQAAMGGAA